MTFTFLYVTCSDMKEANNISKTLLSKKLIACANFFPVESMYQWKGKIKKGKEAVLILKTMKNKVAMVRKEIEKYSDKLILEAAFLDPKELSKFGELILIVTTDETKHRTQYYKHRDVVTYPEEKFLCARMIQEYLLEEAKNFTVKVVENNSEMKAL